MAELTDNLWLNGASVDLYMHQPTLLMKNANYKCADQSSISAYKLIYIPKDCKGGVPPYMEFT